MKPAVSDGLGVSLGAEEESFLVDRDTRDLVTHSDPELLAAKAPAPTGNWIISGSADWRERMSMRRSDR